MDRQEDYDENSRDIRFFFSKLKVGYCPLLICCISNEGGCVCSQTKEGGGSSKQVNKVRTRCRRRRRRRRCWVSCLVGRENCFPSSSSSFSSSPFCRQLKECKFVRSYSEAVLPNFDLGKKSSFCVNVT